MTTGYEMPPLRATDTTSRARPTTPEPSTEVAPVEAATPDLAMPTPPKPGVLARVGSWTRKAMQAETKRADKGHGIWGEHPPSLAYLLECAKASKWATSEAELKRWAAAIDRWLITIPVTALLYVLAWIVQRPSRRIAAMVIALVILNYR